MSITQAAVKKLILQYIGGAKIKGAGQMLVAGLGREVIVKSSPLTSLVGKLRAIAGQGLAFRDTLLNNPLKGVIESGLGHIDQIRSVLNNPIIGLAAKNLINTKLGELESKIGDFQLHTDILSGTNLPNVFNGLETSITTAQSTATSAFGAAATAQASAVAAQADATTAISAIGTIGADNKLSAVEKRQVILEKTALDNEKAGLDARATSYNITTEKATYDTAINALATYLGTLTSPVPWNITTAYTTIVAADWQTNWSAVYTARAALRVKIEQIAGERALWPSVTGSGRPADNATVNIITYGTAPTGPVDGDVWVDTTAVPTVTRVRYGGAWLVGANLSTNTNQLADGAGLGSTAVWGGVTGTGRPADNATVNIVTYSSSTPAAPINGDIWTDTTTAPFIVRVRVAGVWQTAANYSTNTNQLADGAGLGNTALWGGVTGTGRPADNATANVPRGIWSNASVVYAINDMVYYNGTIYMCILAHTSTATVPSSNATRWTKYSSATLDDLSDGSTYARIASNELASGIPRLSIVGSGRRIGDQRNLPPIASQNLRYKFTGAITYTSVAGTPATGTISVAAGSSYLGSTTLSYNAMSVNVTGPNSTAVAQTVRYQLYIDDLSYTAGTQSLVATTDGNIIYQNDARVWIGVVDVIYPATGAVAGGGGGSGGGGGGGGGGGIVP